MLKIHPNWGLVLVCLITLVSGGRLFSQETFRLSRLVPVPGNYSMEVNSTNEMNTTIGDKKIPNVTKQKQIWSYIVGPEKDGKQDIRLQMKKIAMTTKVNDQTVMDYESGNEDKNNELVSFIYEAMIQSEIICHIQNGKPVSLDGIDKMWKLMEKNVKPEMKQMLETFKKQMGDRQLTDTLLLSNKFLPVDRDVKIGDTWQVDYDQDVPMLGKMTGKINCVLKKVDVKDGTHVATIETKGDIKTGADNISRHIPGVLFKKMSMNMAGTLEYVIETGVISRNDSTNTMNMEMEISQPVPTEKDKSKKTVMTITGTNKNAVTLKKAE